MITVIIPILNAMPYLPEALASLEAQIFRDFEVCLWDNGSLDGSVEEAQRWIPGKLPGRVVTDRPLSLHECLATMVEEAGTEFVARMDGDDICMPERFKLQVATMEADAGLAGVGGQMDVINESGRVLGAMDGYRGEFHAVLAQLLFQCPMPHPAMMMRREMVLAAGNYRIPKPIEDFDLWFRLARVGKLVNLKESVLKYRIIGSSIMNQAKQSGIHGEAIRRCLRANYPEAFGIFEQEFDKLWEKRHPMAFFPMLRAARWIAERGGVELNKVLACREFLFSARCYTAKWDVFSKVIYRLWEKV
jgi:glycosyltransferase involved in cell wall biosynthesis